MNRNGFICELNTGVLEVAGVSRPPEGGDKSFQINWSTQSDFMAEWQAK